MAFCTKCGAQNADGVGFCTTCGNPLAAAPAAPVATPPAASQYAPPAAPVMYQAVPMAPAQPNLLVVMWNSLDLGAKIAGVGALVAAIGFFLPLVSYGDTSYNGFKYATMSANEGGDMAYWFRILLPLVALGLLYFYYNNDLRTKIIVATAHIAIGSIWGFQILRIVTGSDYLKYMQFGWYAHTLGLLAIAVGGAMSILDLTKRLRGVR